MALPSRLDEIITKNIRMTPFSVLPNANLTDGQLAMNGGILYTYDLTRAKWLSVQRQTLIFSRNGTTNNQYLNFAGGGISSKSGYRMMRNACIVGMSVQTSTPKDYIIHLRRNDNSANLVSLTASGVGVTDITINNNTITNDYLQCYLEYLSVDEYGVDDPIVYIEFAWRQ